MLDLQTVPSLSFNESSQPQAGAATNVNVNFFSPESVLDAVKSKIAKRKGFALATINLDHVVKLSRDKAFLKAYREHDLVVADGFPIVWLGRLAGAKRIQRTAGSDLLLPLVALAHQAGAKIALVGTTDDVLETAAAQLEKEYPGLAIAFRESPPFGFDPDSEAAADLLRRLEGSGAALCFLALGAPKQEKLAAAGGRYAPSVGFVSIGASLDFIAGRQKRAPRWMQEANLEWLWRLATDPRRLFGRYACCALVFPLLLLRALKTQRSRS
jgi:exopolysaccharide biosynthesis WecB/TagA/CpsF family protein